MISSDYDYRLVNSTCDNSEAFDRCMKSLGYRSLSHMCHHLGLMGGYVPLMSWRLGRKCERTPVMINGELDSYLKRLVDLTGIMEYEWLPRTFSRCGMKMIHDETPCFDSYREFVKCIRRDLDCMFECLSDREKIVLKIRFGIDQEPMTLKRAGRYMGVTGNRVRQIEMDAIHKLRHPRNIRKAKDSLEAMHDMYMSRKSAGMRIR